MLKLLIDENVPKLIIAHLRKSGHDVAVVMAGSPDKRVAAQAKQQKRVLITFDSDFVNILAYPPAEYWGIVRLRVEPPLIRDILRALEQVFSRFSKPADFKGRLFIVNPDSLRIREP